MENQNVTNVLQAILSWCSSFIGTVTILAILAVIIAIIVMAAKESYGKESFGYRVFRLVAIAIYAIIALNVAGTFIMHLLSIKWLTTTILCIIYIVGLWISFDIDSIVPAIVVTIILVGGSYGIYQDLLITTGFGTFSGFISLVVCLIILLC